MIPFYKKILEFRAKNGLSMVYFAKMCKVSFQTIYNIENELCNPTRTTVAKIELAMRDYEEQKGEE